MGIDFRASDCHRRHWRRAMIRASSSPFGFLLVLVLLIGFIAHCGAPSSMSKSTGMTEVAPLTEGNVGLFTSTPRTFSTNSFWIEGPTALVLVDLHFTPSEAERFVAAAEAKTGKRAVLAIVLHANPDKFNGTETLQKRGVRVITSEQVRALIPDVFRRRTEAFASRYAPDWPKETPAPESFGSATREIEAAGLKLKLHVLGAGCSEAHVVVEHDQKIFVGDLVANKNHSWLELGKTDEWRARMQELKALAPTRVYPGRGQPAGPEILDEQASYVAAVAMAVAEEKPTMPAPPGALQRVAEKIKRRHPDYDFDVFLDIGLPAVWESQARRK